MIAGNEAVCGTRGGSRPATLSRLIDAAALTIIKICLVALWAHLFPSPRLRLGFVSLGLLYGIAGSPLMSARKMSAVHLHFYCSEPSSNLHASL